MNERGAWITRIMNDGRILDLMPLTFDRVRLTISEDIDSPIWIEGW